MEGRTLPIQSKVTALQWRGFTPFHLVSLLDVIRFYANRFARIMALIGDLRATAVMAQMMNVNDPGLHPIANDPIVTQFDELRQLCFDSGLELSAKKIKIVMESMRTVMISPANLQADMDSILERVCDELELRFVFLISRKKGDEYYNKENIFGEDVFNNFADSIYDIEEAGKCFALARYTACVLHLQRVMETAVIAYSKLLGLTVAINNWGAILNTTGQVLTERTKNKTWPSKGEEDFCLGVQPLLISVKNAWRNPSMHVERSYDEEAAKDIFEAVKGFMRHIAKHLDQDGNFTLSFYE